MATSDGESCSAEDRAVDEWRSHWDNITSWTLEDVFRAGFCAGQEHPKLGTLADAAFHATLLERQGAAAGPQLGVELSKIRDRLNTLEANQQRSGLIDLSKADFLFGERLAKLEQRPEPDHHGRFMAIEQRLDAITERANGQGKRIEALKLDEEKDCEAITRLHKRLEALEATRTSERYAEAVLNGLSERIVAVEKDWVQIAALVSELQEWKVDRDTWERRQLQRLKALEQDTPKLCELIERIRALEEQDHLCGEHCIKVDQSLDMHHQRLDAIEAKLRLLDEHRMKAIESKLRLLEPIG